jgi:hypothetical protein
MARTKKRRSRPGGLSARATGLVAGKEAHQVGRHNAGRDLYILNESLKAIGNTVAALHQLPPDIADFTGRSNELDSLTSLLAQRSSQELTTPVVISISGKPGVGKSALAIHIAHIVAADFPDGQLYVDLRGADQERLEPAEVLGQLLRALGIAADAIPETLAERGAYYRSRLANARMLLCLDNAFDERQVRPLIPASANSVVLITTRAPLGTLPGAHSVILDVPDLADAVDLFRSIAGAERVDAEPTESERVARRCGLLPLAIRIVGARLRSRPQWSVAHLADRLDRAAERQRLDEFEGADLGVRASLTLSYYGGGQRVWRLRRLTCGNAKLASPHLIAPVITRFVGIGW